MRSRILGGAFMFCFLLLLPGLFYTQVLKYNFYKELSERNRIRILPIEAPRGRIYDRNGKLLVTNRISFDVEIIYQEIENKDKVADTLSSVLKIDRKLIFEKIKKAKRLPFAPQKVAEDVEKKDAIQLEEERFYLPGVIVTTRPMRSYIYKSAFSHMIGYLGKISESELEKYKSYGYGMRDFIGKDGIERSYNDYLKGRDGGLQMEVDSRGRHLRLLAIKEPIPGKDLTLSVDMELQIFCDSVLGDKMGAIVAIEPESGEVLALVSHPDYDPNVFVEPNNSKPVSKLLADSASFPMFDRAINGAYPPGSVFKIVVATAALDSDIFDDKRTFFCNGSYSLGGHVFNCWKQEGHKDQSLKDAMKHSCNVFFYQLGVLVGVDKIAEYAFKFGLGKPTGIDLPGESGGLVPTVSWKRKNMKEAWFKGETVNYAIGQGYLLVTPIQVARLLAAVSNGGSLIEPFLVNRISGIEIRHGEPQGTKIKNETLEIIKNSLRNVVNDDHGTGFYARSKEAVISGKTGTAQNPNGISHAWFVGFAPFEDPKISIVVFLEHGGKGGLEPARFAKKIIEEAKRLELL